MHAVLELRRLVVMAVTARGGDIPLEDRRSGIGAPSDLVSAMAIGAGCGSKIAFLQDSLSVDTLLEQRHDPRPRDPLLGDDFRIGMATGTGLVNLRAMNGRQGVAARCDGVSCVARDAGRQVPGFACLSGGVNAGRHLRRLAPMTRRAQDARIGGYLPDPVAAMTCNAISAGAAAAQLGMSALRNPLMRTEMASTAADRLRRLGVRPFRDAGMALGTGQLFVRRLTEVGRLYEQRSVPSSSGLFLQVGIAMTGQTLLRNGRRRPDGPHGIRGNRQTQPDKEKASSRLSAVYAPGYHARYGIATHVIKRDTQQQRSRQPALI